MPVRFEVAGVPCEQPTYSDKPDRSFKTRDTGAVKKKKIITGAENREAIQMSLY